MCYIILFTSLLLLVNVFAEGPERLLTPCSRNDLACLSKSALEYTTNTAGGKGEPYNIKPTDPIEVASIDWEGCCDSPPTSMFHFKNVKITGAKDLKLTGFKMDEDTKTTYINMTSDLTVTADMTLDYMEKGKTFSGTMVFKPKLATRSHYNFEFKNDDKGVTHLYLGPETTECEALGDPDFTFNKELQESLIKDPDVRAKMEQYPTQLVERRQKFACKISEIAIPLLFDSFRQGCKVMSTADLFTDA